MATALDLLYFERIPSPLASHHTPFATFSSGVIVSQKLLDKTNSFYILTLSKNYWKKPIVLNR